MVSKSANKKECIKVKEQTMAVDGVRVAAVQAAIRYLRLDLALIELAEGSITSAVITRNRFVAAPIEVLKKHIDATPPRYLLINSGCANAGLGKPGVDAAMACCEAVANAANVPCESILPFSTGVIGEPLPVEKITKCVPKLITELGDDNWLDAARAIMTTDTGPKTAGVVIQDDDGRECRLFGIAKGSGMIAPNMATMLAFVVTDTVLTADEASAVLSRANECSFNAIAVDGDTSTNDACTLSATGRSGVTLKQLGDRFEHALTMVMQDLAHAIVKDGEGATHVITIRVEGAKTEADAREIARTVALSPLVKTAAFANDPNWGRIVAALGRAPVAFDFNAMRCWIGDQLIFADGERAPDYDETKTAKCMSETEWELRIALKEGTATAVFRTCDFSTEYVTINAAYRS